MNTSVVQVIGSPMHLIVAAKWSLWRKLKEKEEVSDPYLVKLTNEIQQRHLQDRFTVHYGVNRLFPKKVGLIDRILHEFHCTPMGGHVNDLNIYKRV